MAQITFRYITVDMVVGYILFGFLFKSNTTGRYLAHCREIRSHRRRGTRHAFY